MPRGGKREGAGRPQGSRNRDQANVEAFARSIVEAPEYQANLRQRAYQGQLAPPIESMLFYYAYGKPPDPVAKDENQFITNLMAVVLKHVGSADARREIRAVLESYAGATDLRAVA
jgi:hypothetical protein